MKTCKARIVMVGHGGGHVFVDDVEVHHVERAEVFVECNERNVMILHIVPDEIEIEGEFEITHTDFLPFYRKKASVDFCREFATGGEPE